MPRPTYARHRFPPVIIRHAVWLYIRFAPSYRDVEDLLAERGIDVSYETVRRWALKFVRLYAKRIPTSSGRASGHWHLDEVFIRIGGRIHYLWRAVNDEGEVLDILVQSKRERKAALKLMRRLLKWRSPPAAIVTDRLRSYGAALRDLGLADRHVTGGRSNNRPRSRTSRTASASAKRRRFRSPESAQQFLPIHAAVYNHFNVQRRLISRQTLKAFRDGAFAGWREVVAAWEWTVCIDPVKFCSCYTEEDVAMSETLEDGIKRWTAKRKSALVVEI